MQTNEFILGDRRLHRRLALTTAIFGKIASLEKRKCSSDYLAREFGCSIGLVEALCLILNRYGFVSKQHKADDAVEWSLDAGSAMISLGDVFIAMNESSHLLEDGLEHTIKNPEAMRDAELLVFQAALDVNESIRRRLKRFYLLSLKSKASRPFFMG